MLLRHVYGECQILYPMSKAKHFLAVHILCLLGGLSIFAAQKTVKSEVSDSSSKGEHSEDSWQIHTQDTRLQFALRDGKPVISSLGTVTPGIDSPLRNWVFECQEMRLPKTVEVNHRKQKVNWKYAGALSKDGRVNFTYRSEEPPLELVSTWQSKAGPGPIEHVVVLTNNADQAVTFLPTPTIELTLRPDYAKELWWVEQSEGAPSEVGTHIESVGPGFAKLLTSGPNISHKAKQRDAIPWFCLHDATSTSGLYGGIEFSGFTAIVLRHTADANLSVRWGLDDREGLTRSRIERAGTFLFPTCFIGAYLGEVDDGCNRLHRWVEDHLRPSLPCPAPILTNNTWCKGVGFDVNESIARKMIDDCSRLGIELFEVDAGWFTTAGNWNVDTDKFPSGIKRLSQYAHSKAIKFGLWVAWSHGTTQRGSGPNVLSPLNPVHKPWFTRDYPADWRRPVPWEGAPVCLGCSDARQWCLKLLRRMIEDYSLDVLRQDQICVVENCSREHHDHIADDPVDVSRSAARGYYEIYDQLRSEFPGLWFEGCNGGGRMVDFGFLKRVHYYQVEDSYRPLATRRAFYDASYPIPPSMLLQWIRSGPAEENPINFKYRLRSAMLGWCSIQMDTTKWTGPQRQAAKEQFALYKQRLRPLIGSANLYHVLSRPDGKRWDGVQYFDSAKGAGVLIVFRPETDIITQRVFLQGLSSEKSYSVRAIDGSVNDANISGKELMESGLNLTLPEQNSSDLVFFTEIKEK